MVGFGLVNWCSWETSAAAERCLDSNDRDPTARLKSTHTHIDDMIVRGSQFDCRER